jgi:hypothetical protein
VLAVATGYTVFESISPTGILSRALIYGPALALLWVLALLVFEVFFSRRAWCRYACPIGLTYGVVGIFSPVRIKYKLDGCFHEGDCRKVCLVPHVLDTVIKGRAVDTEVPIGRTAPAADSVCRHLPDGFAHFRRQGPVQAALNRAPCATLPAMIRFENVAKSFRKRPRARRHQPGDRAVRARRADRLQWRRQDHADPLPAGRIHPRRRRHHRRP